MVRERERFGLDGVVSSGGPRPEQLRAVAALKLVGPPTAILADVNHFVAQVSRQQCHIGFQDWI
jgi:hypothetical protein